MLCVCLVKTELHYHPRGGPGTSLLLRRHILLRFSPHDGGRDRGRSSSHHHSCPPKGRLGVIIWWESVTLSGRREGRCDPIQQDVANPTFDGGGVP